MPTIAEAALTQPDPCPYCAQPTGQGCVTLAARVPTKPHGKRLVLGRVFLAGAASRDGEVDGLKFIGNQIAAERNAMEQRTFSLTADLHAEQAARTTDRDVAARLVADLRAQLEALTPKPTTTYGMNLSPGDSFTKPAAKETAAQQATRIKATYGALPAAKVFYQGALPATFNTAYEGLVDVAAVCFKVDQDALAAGSLDAALNRYLDSVPAGHKVLLVNWQEPDDEIWVTGQFTAAQHKAATDHLCDVVHNHAAGRDGRAEVWSCFMGYSLDVGRFTDAAVSLKVDGIGWDYYWNQASSRVADPTPKLKKFADVTRLLGIKAWSIFETGDNPDSTDPTGSKRAAHWTKVYDATAVLGYEMVCYFNAIGTTGDHRLLPGQPYSDPTIAMVAARMGG